MPSIIAVMAPPTVPENTVSMPRLAPRLTPDRTSEGGSGSRWRIAHDGAVAGRARDREAARAARRDADRMMQADRVGLSALVVLGRDDPDLCRKLGRHRFENGEAGRVDAVVVGKQDAVERESGRQASELGRFDRRNVKQPLDHLRLLRAGYRMPAGHDEAGHPVDAEAMGAKIVRVDLIDFLGAGQEDPGRGGVQPARGRDGQQHRGLPDVAAIREVRREQSLDHGVRPAETRGPTHHPVGVHAARRPSDALEGERDALGAAELGDGGVEPARPVLATEFPYDVVRAATSRRAACPD